MIVLTAVRISVDDHYEFRIEAPGHAASFTKDPVKAARILSWLGVRNPLQLVVHAQEWGAVEIVQGAAGERNAAAGPSPR